MSSIYKCTLPPLVIQNSDDGQTIIVKPLGEQVVADFPRDDAGLRNAKYMVHCANNFMAAVEALKQVAETTRSGHGECIEWLDSTIKELETI